MKKNIKCPYCLEKIDVNTKKCIFCGGLVEKKLNDEKNKKINGYKVYSYEKYWQLRFLGVAFVVILLLIIFYYSRGYKQY